jgi:hypothetical protein
VDEPAPPGEPDRGAELRLELSGHRASVPAARRAVAGVDREGGWGLVLVERTADRWGSVQGEEHCVWFELDRAESPGAAQPGAGSTDTATPA